MRRVRGRVFSLRNVVILTVLGSLGTLQGQTRFRPESEREEMGRTSAYEEWIEQEGIPIYRGQAIPNLSNVQLGPWKRLGVQGAYLVLDGMEGLLDTSLLEIPVGGKTNPEKHFFEENILILSGEGETQIWLGEGESKQSLYWRQGSVFSPPLNSWHQHFNRGQEPAKFVSITNSSFLMDFFHDAELLFNIETKVTSRYHGEANYFDPEISRDYAPYKGKHSLSIVNMIRNARSSLLSPAGQGYGDVDRHYVLSNNMMGTHIEAFPVGTYERAHRHGAGAAIIFLGGVGYSLYWPAELGIHPFRDGKGDQVQKVPWQDGTLFVPADQWFHQHFNTGKEPARFIKLAAPFGPGGDNVVFKTLFKIATEDRRYMIKYREEDGEIRKRFEADLKRNGATLKMPPLEELIALEREAEKESGGMLQNVRLEP